MTRFRNLIGEKSVGLSKESLNFLKDWMWNKSKLKKYQKNGLGALPNNTYNELRKYRPDSPKEVFRVFENLKSERKSRQNKLLSFSPHEKTSKGMWLDQTTVGHTGSYLYRVEVDPDAMLVDTSTFKKDYDDIIPEVIVITERADLE